LLCDPHHSTADFFCARLTAVRRTYEKRWRNVIHIATVARGGRDPATEPVKQHYSGL
jgi:hypothetical protein